MWPAEDATWPRPIPEIVTVQEFIDVFAMFGYEECSSELQEPGFDKIALYTKHGEPEHAALQLPNGHWTSKLGGSIDIEHVALSDFPPDLYCLAAFGGATHFFRRPKNFRRRWMKRVVLALRVKLGWVNTGLMIATK